jgi:hypothetical protein
MGDKDIVNDKKLHLMLSRTNRCVECLERWVNDPSLILNVTCLILVKVAFHNIKLGRLDKETEEELLHTIYGFLEQYIRREFEKKRKETENE